MNKLPIFKVGGLERRLLKKNLSYLKSLVKNWDYNTQLEKDLVKIYTGKDIDSKILFKNHQKLIRTLTIIDIIENELSKTISKTI
jgi:hypothetical protein